MKTDGIIFDLDGTLWNATVAICAAWSEVLKEYPEVKTVVTVEKLEGCMGLLLKDISKKLFPELSEEKRDEMMDKCCEKQVEYLSKNGGILYEGVEETIKALSERFDLYIVSNCQDGYIQSFLEGHKLWGYFKDFTCPGVTGKKKGENIKMIAEKYGMKEPVYVGDTQGDADAAKSAGVRFVFAAYGFGEVKEYDERVERIGELTEVMEK
ncbi:MAG: HAD family hydrolase [Firmicutes bacterium]|nr:HAD family hydrolase [Bacillota bacterium]